MSYENYPFFSMIVRDYSLMKVFFPVGIQFSRLDYRAFEPTGECNVSQMVKLLVDIGSVNFWSGLVSIDDSHISAPLLNDILQSAEPRGKKIPDSYIVLDSFIDCVLTKLPIKFDTPRHPNSKDTSINIPSNESFSKWAIDFIDSLVGPLDVR